MKSLGILLLVAALVIALIASFGVYKYLENAKNMVIDEKIEYQEYFVAKENIAENTKITENMIEVKKISKKIDTSIYISEKEDIVNKYAYVNIIKGEGFMEERLLDEANSKLIVNLEKGKRAVSISVTQYKAVADLIKPSDYVDVYAFIPEKVVQSVIIRENISKLILQKIRVLAIKQVQSRDYSSPEKVPDIYAVTLELRPEDIEKIVLVEGIGQLKLALRGIDDNGKVNTDGETWRELLLEKDLYKEWLEIEEKKEEEKQISEKKEYENYIVKYGDTLMKIARKFYNDYKKYYLIKDANNIGDENLIITGETLKIPILDK